MARDSTLLFVGTNRHVAAIDPRTGEEMWRTKLPKGAASHPVTLLIKGQQIYAGHHGHVFCLNRRDGTILWHNDLPRMSYYPVLLAMEGATGASAPAGVAAASKRKRPTTATAATSG